MSQKQILLVAKLGVTGAWLAGLAGFFLPVEPSTGQTLRLVFYGLAIVHVVECAFFFKTLKDSGRPLLGQVLRTLAFGVVHYAGVKAELEMQQQPTD
jgi:uncharacterized protein YhhL (DUF1145 family)